MYLIQDKRFKKAKLLRIYSFFDLIKKQDVVFSSNLHDNFIFLEKEFYEI